MAVQFHTPDTSTDEEREGGQGRTRWKGEELAEEAVGKEGAQHTERRSALLRHQFKSAGRRNACTCTTAG